MKTVYGIIGGYKGCVLDDEWVRWHSLLAMAWWRGEVDPGERREHPQAGRKHPRERPWQPAALRDREGPKKELEMHVDMRVHPRRRPVFMRPGDAAAEGAAILRAGRRL